MKKLTLILTLLIAITSCKAQEDIKTFSEKALADILIDTNGNDISFSKILETYKGKQIVIDVWASWCKDCINGMPKVQALQDANKDTVFLFLSLDKTNQSWKKGIEKYNVKGEHYYLKSGWKGDLATFLDLDWIPRYLVIDKTGNITVFKAIKADDKKLTSALKL